MIKFNFAAKKYLKLIGIFLSIFLFAIIYHFVDNSNFLNQNKNFDWVESLYFSASIQSLLGLGELTPSNNTTRIIVIIQIFITLILTFL